MMNLYDLERLNELRMAELNREGSGAAPRHGVATAGPPFFRGRLATALIALAVRLAP